MQMLVSLVGVPSHDILVGSKCAPGTPVIGASGTSRPMRPSTVPSFGATSHRKLAAARRHVLRHQGRVAGQVLAHVLGNGAGPQIVSAPDPEADDHPIGFSGW